MIVTAVLMMKARFSHTGRVCGGHYLSSEERTDEEKETYDHYDCGLPPFEETECYKLEREVLNTLERDLEYSLKCITQPVIMGGPGSRPRRRK